MKRLLIFLLCAMLVFTTGCSINRKDSDNKINIVCSAFPQYDFVRQIAKDKADIQLLLPPGSEAHSYEPSPKDIISIKDANLFIAIGGDSEHWAIHLLQGEELKSTPTLFLIDSVNKFTEEHKEGMEDTHHSHEHIHSDECIHDEEEEKYDEHIWTSPKNSIIMCNTICDYLCNIDPLNSDYYKKNTKEYINKLTDLFNRFNTLRNKSKRNTVVFGDRFPLRYLTEDLSLDYYAAFPGCSSKTEPSVKTLIFLTEKIKEEKIPVVFYMDYSDGRTAKTIASECNIKASRLYSCHNLSKKDFESGETYLSLMEKNLNSIKEALN